ncbi:RNA polymerase sigma-70 factor (sigma-E family) [Kribbella amoyensis]|uniref:RNA polymerase sigma-70 factor (Sigma-E family) n=1 Tax=Kribbella amoyensis TaxID=996641 RepID=A0A561BVF7_9ACTN|nr:sigma-70 family RNA polymerase sigma factor [Kribbella amoyensis]TWD82876.1 RNA polymerase sigma-70 factor (sigma-E family) [Kribbella amoyensis]
MVSLGRAQPVPVPDDRTAAVARLYREHWLGLVRLAVLIVDDRPSAEDVVQEAFTELYRRWPLKDDTKALQYLRSTVLNRSRSVLRRRRVARLYLPPAVRPDESAESAAELSENRREVQLALRSVPLRTREVLVLRYYLDLSHAEIARLLGISESGARSTASRGLAILTRKLEEQR